MNTINIIRSHRRTLALEITSTGELRVRAPYLVSERDIQKFVESKSNWIEKHLRKLECDKGVLDSEGRFSEEELKKLVKLAKQVIPEKVAYYARIMNVTYGRISIRKQRSRWGSCSREGNLNFNCLLMLAPEEVLDYVIVHELCHLKEMNHSKKFWAEVKKVLPDYELSYSWLRKHGSELMAQLPEK
jgi:predicted metal-dependent hydrolase